MFEAFKAGYKAQAPVINSSITAVSLSALLAYKVSTATTVLAGPTAVAGAIKTLTVTLANGQVIVYSLVKASLLSKAIMVTAGIIAIAGISYAIYHASKPTLKE